MTFCSNGTVLILYLTPSVLCFILVSVSRDKHQYYEVLLTFHAALSSGILAISDKLQPNIIEVKSSRVTRLLLASEFLAQSYEV